jgi:Ni,Fe-hydrogenase I cytochrome b subunit
LSRLVVFLRIESSMQFPLGFLDLSLWTAVVAIILLITSEFLSPYYGRTGILIDRRRLRLAALVVAFIFLVTVVFRIYELIMKT